MMQTTTNKNDNKFTEGRRGWGLDLIQGREEGVGAKFLTHHSLYKKSHNTIFQLGGQTPTLACT